MKFTLALLGLLLSASGQRATAEPHGPEVTSKDLPIGGIREKGGWTYHGGSMYFNSLELSPDGSALWAATSKGVVRLDIAQERLTRFSTLDGLADNYTYDLAFDRRGALWVATYSGLSRLDAKGWHSWRRADGLSSAHLDHLAIDALQEPWVSAGVFVPATISRLSGVRWVHYSELGDGLSALGVDEMVADPEGQVWAALYDGAHSSGRPGNVLRQANSLVRFLPDGTWREVGLPAHLLALNTRRAITALEALPGSRLVAGTPLGLFMWDGQKWARWGIKEGLPDEHIVDLSPGPDGKIWGLTRKGVFSFDGEKAETESIAFPDMGPLSLRSGKLVVGSQADFWITPDPPVVLIHIVGRIWTIYVPELDGPVTHFDRGVRTILKDAGGQLYFGALGAVGGLTRFDGKKWEIVYGGDVLDAALDASGTLWIVNGAALRQVGQEWANETAKLGLAGHAWFVHCDRRGHLWVGGMKDLVEWDGNKTIQHTGQIPELFPPYFKIASGPAGHLWLWSSQGLLQWKGEHQWTFSGKSSGHPGLKGTALGVGMRGEVFFGGPWGAARFDGLTFHSYVREGTDHYEALPVLPGTGVQSILQDRRGVLWLGTDEGGVGSFDGKAWGKMTTANGLPSNNVGCIFEEDDGIWFGTMGGVSRYRKPVNSNP